MTSSRPNRTVLLLLVLCITLGTGCAGFNQGYQDGLVHKADEFYGWGHEIYEFPLGLVGIPIFLVLSPFIAPIPHEEFGPGYLIGETWAGVRILIDPTVNYGG